MERDGLTETSTRSQRALVRSLNFIQKELSSNGRIKEGSNLLLILYTDIWCKVLKVYSGCGVECRVGGTQECPSWRMPMAALHG